MSVALLGLAGVQLVALQQNRDALLRAEATQLAGDMLDRMRANPAQDYTGVGFDDPPSGTVCAAKVCSAAQMKSHDIGKWKCSINARDGNGRIHPACEAHGVEGSLPGGGGAIVGNADGGLGVLVQWVPGRDGVSSSVSLRGRIN